MIYYIMKGKGSTSTIIDTEFYTPIDYRPTPVGQQTITGRRDIEGINYVGGGEIKVSRLQALGLGEQNIADLGSGQMPPYATTTRMRGGRKMKLGRLHVRHLGSGNPLLDALPESEYDRLQKTKKQLQRQIDNTKDPILKDHLRGKLRAINKRLMKFKTIEMKGSGMVGSGLFTGMFKVALGGIKAYKKIKKGVKLVRNIKKGLDFIEDAGKFFSRPDAGKAIGKEIAGMLSKAEKEVVKAGKSIKKSAEAGTLLSDALKLTATAVDKYGPEMAGFIAGGIVSSATGGVGGFVAKQVASQLTKEITGKLKLNEITADAINKLAKEAEQKGLGMVGGNTITTGRPQPHLTYKSASRLTVPHMSRGMTNKNESYFNSMHPMNFRKASIRDI